MTGVHGSLTRSSCLIEPETTGHGPREQAQRHAEGWFKFWSVSSFKFRPIRHDSETTKPGAPRNRMEPKTRALRPLASTKAERKQDGLGNETGWTRKPVPGHSPQREQSGAKPPRFRVHSDSPGLRTLHSALIKLESARRSIRWHSRHNLKSVLSSLSSLGLRLARTRSAGCV